MKRYFIITCFGDDFTPQQQQFGVHANDENDNNHVGACDYFVFHCSSLLRRSLSCSLLPRFNLCFFFHSHFRFHWNAKNVCTTIMTMICEILCFICASMLVVAHRSLMYLFIKSFMCRSLPMKLSRKQCLCACAPNKMQTPFKRDLRNLTE